MISPLLLGKSPFRVVSSVSSHKNRSFPIQPSSQCRAAASWPTPRSSAAASKHSRLLPSGASAWKPPWAGEKSEMSNPSRGRTTWLSWVHKLRNGPLLLYSWLIDEYWLGFRDQCLCWWSDPQHISSKFIKSRRLKPKFYCYNAWTYTSYLPETCLWFVHLNWWIIDGEIPGMLMSWRIRTFPI